jgi:hypothetical protein
MDRVVVCKAEDRIFLRVPFKLRRVFKIARKDAKAQRIAELIAPWRLCVISSGFYAATLNRARAGGWLRLSKWSKPPNRTGHLKFAPQSCKGSNSGYIRSYLIQRTRQKGFSMATDYRPTVVGAPAQGKKVDPRTAIEKMENELAEMAVSIRKTRRDYVDGMISDAELDKVEKQFMNKLTEQRNILQLLRRSAGAK